MGVGDKGRSGFIQSGLILEGGRLLYNNAYRWIILYLGCTWRSSLAKTLEVLVGELLRRRGLRLSVAESCTGGLIGHLLTNVAGSSTYYMGSVTAYAYEAKVRLLGVSWDTLEKYGAVSAETALEMAQGIRLALVADIGISVTGIAGPTGGTPDKPVGTVWIGISTPNEEYARHFLWFGSRLAIKKQSANAALNLLAEHLQKDTG
jgi:nicotinamide-nucleotide amidase